MKKKDENANLLGKLQAKRRFLDDLPIIKAWKKWLLLPYFEQQRIRSEWDQYYKNVEGTIAYARFRDQKDALADGDLVRVKELAEEARQARIDGTDDTLPKPSGFDPFDFDFGNDVTTYRSVERQIKELTDYPAEEQRGWE